VSAPPEILKLVERFELHRDEYLSGGYHETQLRREFVDPLFKALGWDIDNEQGFAEAYKDVVHEDAIGVGAPDYCFRIGGTRKFFLEAKRPAENIESDATHAFQLRRYAWSAKLPLSILTDFEEFAVYDTRIKPQKTDKASKARVLYLRSTQYVERWEEIAGVFAREAVLKGSFDRFAESTKSKRGTSEVDGEFLREIEGWRLSLARNLALRNPEIGTTELNFAVQRIIDRLVFLRIAEDRGIEAYGQLQKLLNGAKVYARLADAFRNADDRYNSGLFHFTPEPGRNEPPDELTLALQVDDEPLKEIIGRLYYPDSPYQFSVLPADILGQVYEQFLGQVIRLTGGHQAKVEDKPEVKKAGGVFYTPTYIVDFIVRQTLGRLLDGKTPRQAAKLRVLDPACGSGSFLIAAYQYLLDWHRDWYVAHDPRQHSKEVYESAAGWRLTTAVRKTILLNNIYGVDIDAQAVEVTKLSLLLKVLEGENRETLERQQRLFHQRALPDLGGNIKCGNSLVGPDFYNGQQLTLLAEEERDRLNIFDWQAEFPGILKAGGFDAVIGNPPYVRMEVFKPLKEYFRQRYVTHEERADLYGYFIEREHGLLRSGGRFGMIVSNKFLRSNYGRPLREYLREQATIEQVVDFAGLPVFRGATVRTVVLITCRNGTRPARVRYCPPVDAGVFAEIVNGQLTVDEATRRRCYAATLPRDAAEAWTFLPRPVERLLQRLKRGHTTLHDYCGGKICRGVVSGLTEAFVIDAPTRNRIVRRNKAAAEILKPFLNGRDVRRYRIEPQDQFLIYTHHGVDIERYPAVEEHLRPFRAQLRQRATRQEWYELQQPQRAFAPYLDGPKIVFPDIATSPRFALDEAGHYGANTVYFIPGRDLFLLALLNSRVAQFYFRHTCAGLEGQGETYLRFFGQYLEGFPVPESDAMRQRCEALVGDLLQLDAQLIEAKTPHRQTLLERQLAALDRQIDQLVYELYDLAAAEIALIEGVTERVDES
jgi:type I restriction-modification system DNA methylase subunit